MGLFSGLVCLFQDHAWSAWAYTAQDSCLQQRQCQRCGAIERGHYSVHAWETTGCARICQRCGIQGKAHAWGEWQGGLRTCKSCGEEEACEHDWVPDACGYDYCPNCGEVMYTSVMA